MGVSQTVFSLPDSLPNVAYHGSATRVDSSDVDKMSTHPCLSFFWSLSLKELIDVADTTSLSRLSHAGTVVPRTTTQVNVEVGNSTPTPSKTPEPIVTLICMGDYVMDPDPYAKSHHDTIPTFAPPPICENAPQVTRLVFWFLLQPTAKTPGPIFTINTWNDVDVSRKDVPFGGREKTFYISTPFFPKKRKFLANFRQDLENFGSKRP